MKRKKIKNVRSKNWKTALDSIRKIFFTRLSIKNQIFFIKRLSFLIKADIPIRDSLVMIREQTKHKGYAQILDKVIHDVSNGQNLSTSLAKFKDTFGDFAINIISFGEEGGILSENLEYVAEELQKRHNLRKKIISASVYPIIVTIVTLGITIFLITYLFPKIMPIFSSINMDLPLSTQLIISINSFISEWGLISLIILIVLIIASVTTIKKSPKVHLYFDEFILKIPGVQKIIQDYNIANFTRTMGLLLKSGVAMNEALAIAGRTIPNLVYKKELHALAGVVNRGAKISTHLAKQKKLFPDVVTQIISVGEHGGNLPDSLMYLSEMYEAKLDDFTKNISNLVEPVLMIFMGILVGFIAISIITPIYNITQHLQPN